MILHEAFWVYRGFRYLKTALLLLGVALAGYAVYTPVGGHNGGTGFGYLLGTVSFGMMIWLMWFGVRKRTYYKVPSAPLRGWLSAHVYLGLVLLVLVPLHSGFQFGWNVHTLAYVLMSLVILSGIGGVLFYSFIPESMTENRSGQKIAALLGNIADIDEEYIPELSVALNHAKMEIFRGQVRLDLLEGDHFTVNGHFKTAPQVLNPGTLVRIGHHELRVVEPAKGEDLALEIEKIESQGHAAEELEKRTKLGISGLLLTRRRLSWVLGLAVFWGFLVLPLSQSGSSGNFLGNNSLTRSWNPGPLAPSHQYFADDCETCHINVFRSVPEVACLD